MQLGVIGLGRMGGNISLRLLKNGHDVAVFDRSEDAVKHIAEKGAQASSDLKTLVAKLQKPRAVWVMLPAGEITEKTIEELATLLEAGDTIIDGGNTFYKDDIRRAKAPCAKNTSTISMSARPAASGAWNAATA